MTAAVKTVLISEDAKTSRPQILHPCAQRELEDILRNRVLKGNSKVACGIATEPHHPKQTLLIAKLPSFDADSKWVSNRSSEAHRICDT